MNTRTYTIQIDEEQRQMINTALQLMHATPNCPDKVNEESGMPVRETLITMFSDLKDLPEDQINHHMVHGFCL